ncbi:hypothetical protein Y1Q_0003033 [Alligator mississippiensis]|uniref:Uncharacterized protein n=1 Tax=Alligator mississippiensis TaxID=8496 RepID=A0A151MD63_ALLMI|nr:hypothetical protein Y1Q_0003033 [Alligator mississippiensis]
MQQCLVDVANREKVWAVAWQVEDIARKEEFWAQLMSLEEEVLWLLQEQMVTDQWPVETAEAILLGIFGLQAYITVEPFHDVIDLELIYNCVKCCAFDTRGRE